MRSMYEHDERKRVIADLEREAADRQFRLQNKIRDITNEAMSSFRSWRDRMRDVRS